MTNILVLWAMFVVGPMHGIEYKSIKYKTESECFHARERVKLGVAWSAQCMTEEQWYAFRQLQ